MMDMRQRIREQCDLAQTYAEDGAYHTASRILSELAAAVTVHAERLDAQLKKAMKS